MNLDFKAAALLLFIAINVHGMQEDDSEGESVLATLPIVKTEIRSNTTKIQSYFQLLTADLWGYMLPFFSYPHSPIDNRGDVIMQTNAVARKVAQLAFEYGNFNLVSDKAINGNFIRASEFYAKEAGDNLQSFFLPNHISLACALMTHGSQKALEEEIDNQMQEFRNLPQDRKNRLFLDVMRMCPSYIIVKKMLDNGADINAQSPESNFTPLRYAVEENSTSIVKLLLHRSRRALINLADKCLVSPLMRAVILQNKDNVRRIARRSHAINAINQFGHTALSYGAKTGDPQIVATLLHYGARTIISDEKQRKNVFVCAVEGGSCQVLQLLLKAHEPGVPNIGFLDVFLNLALKRAAELGDEDMVRHILWVAEHSNENPVNVRPDTLYEDEKNTALTAALGNEHTDIAKLLIRFAYDRYYKQLREFDDTRSLALAWALFKMLDLEKRKPEKSQQFKQIAELLLDDDTPNPLGNKLSLSACFFAAQYGNIPLLTQLLVYASARTDQCKERALQEVVESGSVPAVETILRTLPDINACDENRENIFFKAVSIVERKSLEILDLLFKNGVNPARSNLNEVTPAHAVLNNPDPVVRLYVIDELHKRKISVDQPDCFGDRPLHLACAKRPFITETAEFLLHCGVAVNAQNKEGNSSLMYAVGADNIELVKLLLQHGADPNRRNNSGCGPLTKAARVGRKELISLLVGAGGRVEDFKDSMLRQAAKRNHMGLMGALLQRGANLNSGSTSYGNTPLHKAVTTVSARPIRRLLQVGADDRVKNRKGETPLELSMVVADPEVVELLLEHKKKN